MNLPARAWIVVAVAVAGGVACLVAVGQHVTELGSVTAGQWALTVLVAVPTGWSWFSPLVLYRGNEAEAFHFDEGAFVLLALFVPSIVTVGAFGALMVAAQVAKRRAPVKSVFNTGQVLMSVGLALLVSRSLSRPSYDGHLDAGQLGAVLAGAVVYFVVNSGIVSALLVSVGSTVRQCLLEGLKLRVYLVFTGMFSAAILAVAVSLDSWTVVFIPAVMLNLRYVLEAQFKAEHDRARLQGLFELTLKANKVLRYQSVLDGLVSDTKVLLHCSQVEMAGARPGGNTMAAPIRVAGMTKWLVASGRPPGRPFDEADRGFLKAMAAVGEGALANADLYRRLGHERQRLSSITLNIGEGVCAIDASERLTFVNPTAAAMVHLPSISVPVGDGVAGALVAPDFLLLPAREVMRTGRKIRVDDARFVGKDGITVPVAYTAAAITVAGRTTGAVIVFRDIRERKAMEDDLTRHAFYDSLTGLANRRMLVERLEHVLERSLLDGKKHALVYIDVDRFKAVNDSLGHGTGDSLLVAIGTRVRQAVRGPDIVARFGGDEFVVLLEDVSGVAEAEAAASRICAAADAPVVVAGGHEIVAALSVGVAVTEPGQSADDVIRDADVAMYMAKGRGGSYRVFDRAVMGMRSSEGIELESALRKGIDHDELEVFYQPLVNLAGGRIVGAEALVRWRRPGEGLIAPDRFIPLAEENGLILPIGRIVLEKACLQVRSIQERLGVGIPISVNLSPRQFQQSGLIGEVTHILDLVGLDPGLLAFEITETLVMEDLVGATEIMKRIKGLGVRLAIDDFGTGHSSLGYLKRFPVDEVKVDRIFVQGVASDPVDTAIVRAVVDLAHAMSIVSIAEGIETRDQLAGLRMLGCQVGQGYLFAKPLAALRNSSSF